MSSWWCTALFVVGKIDEIQKFEGALPSLFDQVAASDRVGGGLTVEVFQNYAGETAVEDAVANFPDLTFAGTQIHEQAHPGDIFWIFTGKDGITEWCEFRLPEDGDRPMTREEVEKEIARIDAKMARLIKQRELLLHQPSNVDAGITEKEVSHADRLRRSDEVASIVNKIRRRRLDVNDAADIPEAVRQSNR